MSRRRVRSVQVDGAEYQWVAAPLSSGRVTVRVWLAAPTRRRQLQIVVPRGPVWPGDLVDLVRAGIVAGWQPDMPGVTPVRSF